MPRARLLMKALLQPLAPYIAVLVCWCIFKNAWLTVVVYHAQILVWSRHRIRDLPRGWNARLFLAAALPCALAGPLLYLLMPHMIKDTNVATWLGEFGLRGAALVAMIPYVGVVHPLLEQVHWSGLRTRGWPAHMAFAGYHGIVLYTLLQPVWLGLCLAILLAASVVWSAVESRTGSGLLVPSLGHVFADLGIVLAAWSMAM